MWIVAGIVVGIIALFAYFPFLRIFLWLAIAIGCFMYVKDVLSEKVITDDGTWDYNISSVDHIPYSTETNHIYQVKGAFTNNGEQFIQSFVIKMTLYTCPSDVSPINECRKIHVIRRLIPANLSPGFQYDFTPRMVFYNINGPNLRPIVNIEDVTVDTDHALEN